MKTPLLKSRKFWLALSDAIFSIATMVITFYLTDKTEVRVLVLGVLATLQPVVIAVIAGLTAEDTALIQADALQKAARIGAGFKVP